MKNNLIFGLSLVFLMQFPWLQAQISRDTNLHEAVDFNPILSTAVIRGGRAEFVFFNNLSFLNLSTLREGPGGAITEQSRQSFLTHIFQLNYGLSKKQPFNVGLDLIYAHVRSDNDPESSFWKVLGNDETTGSSVHAFRAMGPRVRWIPFRYLPELSVQSAVHFPVSGDAGLKQRIGQDRVLWQNQAVFYQHILPNLTWQMQGDAVFLFKNTARKQNGYSFSLFSNFTYRLLQQRLFALGTFRYQANYQESVAGGLRKTGFETWLGIGLYWRVSPRRWSLTAGFSKPVSWDIGSLISTVNEGTWSSFNIGVLYNFQVFSPSDRFK